MVEEQTNAERPATRMLGHYEMLEQIGQGGMAIVYKGLQPSLNRTVAIKVLPERFARTEELLARFDREANIAAQLNHPNIVQVIDRGKEGETLFIVMEFVNGVSLDRLIREGKISVVQALDYAVQICDALEYAHAKGVIHRDLKPSNILVDNETGRAKISDFGIAAIEATGSELSTLTRENVALGTINYMSPEQRLNSHTVTVHTDIFSFGVVLYELLTGSLPIGHFKLPSFVNHQAPIGFDEVVKKCLAQSPADRYQSAAEIKADLGRITGRHLKPQSKSGPTPVRDWRSLARRYAIAGGAAVLVIAIAAAFLIHRRHAPTPPSAAATAAAAAAADAQAEEDALLAERMENCQLEWKALKKHGTFSSSYYAPEQQQLVNKLNKLISDYPKSQQVSPALQLIAEVCQQPDLNDWKTATDALVRLSEREPANGADPLFQAAELYNGKLKDKAAAQEMYARFVRDFPDDPRAAAARKRLNADR